MRKIVVVLVAVVTGAVWAPTLLADDFTATNGGHWK